MERAKNAINKVRNANNGYAYIGADKKVAKACEEAGLKVAKTYNPFTERMEYKGYTAKAWAIATEDHKHTIQVNLG